MPLWKIKVAFTHIPAPGATAVVLVRARTVRHALEKIEKSPHLRGVKIVSAFESDIDRVLA